MNSLCVQVIKKISWTVQSGIVSEILISALIVFVMDSFHSDFLSFKESFFQKKC